MVSLTSLAIHAVSISLTGKTGLSQDFVSSLAGLAEPASLANVPSLASLASLAYLDGLASVPSLME